LRITIFKENIIRKKRKMISSIINGLLERILKVQGLRGRA